MNIKKHTAIISQYENPVFFLLCFEKLHFCMKINRKNFYIIFTFCCGVKL